MSERVHYEEHCRVCKGFLEDVIDLGLIHPSGFTKTSDGLTEDNKAPLVLAKCTKCNLIQLRHTIDLDLMYRQYWYSSSLNKSMVSSLKKIVTEIEGKIKLKEGDIVLDIGCNDGTMLETYSQQGILRVGFDPALNLQRKEFPLFLFSNNYFTREVYQKEMGDMPKVKVITAIAMFYDLPDPNKFVQDVADTLAKDGIFVVQFTDLLNMFGVTAFDNICHEHLEYYTLSDVKALFEAHNLEVIDVSYNDVNGGSIRITASHEGSYPVSDTVQTALKFEGDFLSKFTIEDFKKNIDRTKGKVRGFLLWAKALGYKVHLLGASTKGNTLLQLLGITDDLISYAAEVNKDKFGLRTVGSNIEIISQEASLIKHPDYYLVPVWHFKINLLNNPQIKDYMESGGALVFPLPEFTICTYNNKTKSYTETRI